MLVYVVFIAVFNVDSYSVLISQSGKYKIVLNVFFMLISR